MASKLNGSVAQLAAALRDVVREGAAEAIQPIEERLNAKIHGMALELREVRGEVGEVRGEVGGLAGKVRELRGEVRELRGIAGEVQELRGEIRDVEERLNTRIAGEVRGVEERLNTRLDRAVEDIIAERQQERASV